jgi:hypothetical protein
MRVKINETWYDSEIQPICIQISEYEQGKIADIDRKEAPQGKFASFPESHSYVPNYIKIKWMNS